MTTGFGRKGLAAGAAYAPGIGSTMGGMAVYSPAAAQADIEDPDLARKREAFLASERARRSDPIGAVSDVASNFSYSRDKPTRSLMMAYFLWFFCCAISAHRVYLGAYQSALAQAGLWIGGVILLLSGVTAVGGLMMLGGGIWMLADVFLIPGIHRKYCASPQTSADVFA